MIVLSAKNLSKVYGTDVIIEKVSFHVNEGDRVGIIGKNGAGKSTLLNMLTGELSCDEGEFFVSQNTRIGYLKQRENFDGSRTVIEEVTEIFRDLLNMEKDMEEIAERLTHLSAASVGAEAEERDMLIHRQANLHDEYYRRGGEAFRSEIRGILNSMAFGPEYYDKRIDTLSGGERTRLALAALLLEKPDILMLDEPTNHLDIGTLKWLEQYLSSYKGTILVVSHDRYFLDKTVDHLFIFREGGNVKDFVGQYSEYREYIKEEEAAQAREARAIAEKNQKNSKPQSNTSAPARKKLSYKEQRELEQLESEIPSLEQQKSELEAALSSGTLSIDELTAASAKIAELIETLEEKEMRWLELSEI